MKYPHYASFTMYHVDVLSSLLLTSVWLCLPAGEAFCLVSMVLDITAWQHKGRCTRLWQIYECFSCCCPTVNLEVPPGTLTFFLLAVVLWLPPLLLCCVSISLALSVLLLTHSLRRMYHWSIKRLKTEIVVHRKSRKNIIQPLGGKMQTRNRLCMVPWVVAVL